MLLACHYYQSVLIVQVDKVMHKNQSSTGHQQHQQTSQQQHHHMDADHGLTSIKNHTVSRNQSILTNVSLISASFFLLGTENPNKVVTTDFWRRNLKYTVPKFQLKSTLNLPGGDVRHQRIEFHRKRSKNYSCELRDWFLIFIKFDVNPKNGRNLRYQRRN